jgi:hypothetical protein
MAKGKSSASSATRKKQAAKAAKKQNRVGGGDDDDLELDETATTAVKSLQPAQRGQKKGNKKQKKDRFAPKVKSYVPPPPPPKGQPDPVDLYLITSATQIDPELIVILRKLAKKDEATISKGLEALDQWIRQVIQLESDSTRHPRDQQDGELPEEQDWRVQQKLDELVESMQVWVSREMCLSSGHACDRTY